MFNKTKTSWSLNFDQAFRMSHLAEAEPTDWGHYLFKLILKKLVLSDEASF